MKNVKRIRIIAFMLSVLMLLSQVLPTEIMARAEENTAGTYSYDSFYPPEVKIGSVTLRPGTYTTGGTDCNSGTPSGGSYLYLDDKGYLYFNNFDYSSLSTGTGISMKYISGIYLNGRNFIYMKESGNGIVANNSNVVFYGTGSLIVDTQSDCMKLNNSNFGMIEGIRTVSLNSAVGNGLTIINGYSFCQNDEDQVFFETATYGGILYIKSYYDALKLINTDARFKNGRQEFHSANGNAVDMDDSSDIYVTNGLFIADGAPGNKAFVGAGIKSYNNSQRILYGDSASDIKVLDKNDKDFDYIAKGIYSSYYAIYTPYTVTFDIGDKGAGTCPDPQTDIKWGELIRPIYNPKDEEYSFEGWSLSPSIISKWDDFKDVVTESITLYAIWNLKEYNIYIRNNVGAGTVKADVEVAHRGETITLTAYPNINKGFKHKGYKVTTAGGVDIVVNDNKFTMPDDNVYIEGIFETSDTDTDTDLKPDDPSVPGTITDENINKAFVKQKIDISAMFASDVALYKQKNATTKFRYALGTKADKRLASVSAKGVITPKKPGKIVVTFQKKAKGEKNWTTLHSIPYEIYGLAVKSNDNKGKKHTITNSNPVNVNDIVVLTNGSKYFTSEEAAKWLADNGEKVMYEATGSALSIDQAGLITVHNNGASKIKITVMDARNSGAVVSFKVQVKMPAYAKPVFFGTAGKAFNLKVLNAVKNVNVVKSSESDNDAIQVNGTRVFIKDGTPAGTEATITSTMTDGQIIKCKVVVK